MALRIRSSSLPLPATRRREALHAGAGTHRCAAGGLRRCADRGLGTTGRIPGRGACLRPHRAVYQGGTRASSSAVSATLPAGCTPTPRSSTNSRPNAAKPTPPQRSCPAPPVSRPTTAHPRCWSRRRSTLYSRTLGPPNPQTAICLQSSAPAKRFCAIVTGVIPRWIRAALPRLRAEGPAILPFSRGTVPRRR